jgi:peptidoglycan-N-acetylglucosamine deacetylase
MANFYLTIDDAPTIHTRQKLEFLEKNKVKAIWFCRGDYIETASGSTLIDCIKAGHLLGNHSFSHPHFSDPRLSLEDAYNEIEKTERLIDELYDKAETSRPAKLFRFPYGDQGGSQKRQNLINFLKEQGFSGGPFASVEYPGEFSANNPRDPYWGWSYDIGEYRLHSREREKPTLTQIQADLDSYLGRVNTAKDQIILIHDHEDTTAYFEDLIKQFLDKGIKFRLPVLTTE